MVYPRDVAEPQNANWEIAKALYFQGVPYAQIAQQVGVTVVSLRKHASRHKWHKMRAAIAISASETANGVEQLSDSPNRSLEERILAELERQLAVLEQNPPKTVSELKGGKGVEGRASVLKRLSDAYRDIVPEPKQQTGIILMDLLAVRPEPEPAPTVDVAGEIALSLQSGTETEAPG